MPNSRQAPCTINDVSYIMIILVSEHAADILCDVVDVGGWVAESCKTHVI